MGQKNQYGTPTRISLNGASGAEMGNHQTGNKPRQGAVLGTRFSGICAFIALLVTLSLPLVLHAEEEANRRAMIFCVDVSGSMREGQLLKRLQAEMVRFVRDPAKLKPGDWFTLITFGSKVSLVEDRRIQSPRDIARIERTIRALEPGESHTYVTKALDLMVTQMKKLQDAEYGDQTLAYLFTDGKNDPPPTVRNPLTFEDIIRKWSLETELAASDLFIYLVTLGISPEPGLRQVQQRFPKQIKIVRRARVPSEAAPMIPPTPIRLRYVPLYGQPLHQQPELELPLAVEVLDLSEHDGEEILLTLETPAAVEARPPQQPMIVTGRGRQTVSFTLVDAPLGEQTVVLRATTQGGAVKVLPASVAFELDIVPPAAAATATQPPTHRLRWFALTGGLLLLLALGTTVTQLVLFPRFPNSYVLENDAGDQWRLRIHQRIWAKVLSTGDLGVDDAQFELLAHNGTDVFMRRDDGHDWRKVLVGREIQQGYRIVEIALDGRARGTSERAGGAAPPALGRE
jgi:hypothetical protein